MTDPPTRVTLLDEEPVFFDQTDLLWIEAMCAHVADRAKPMPAVPGHDGRKGLAKLKKVTVEKMRTGKEFSDKLARVCPYVNDLLHSGGSTISMNEAIDCRAEFVLEKTNLGTQNNFENNDFFQNKFSFTNLIPLQIEDFAVVYRAMMNGIHPVVLKCGYWVNDIAKEFENLERLQHEAWTPKVFMPVLMHPSGLFECMAQEDAGESLRRMARDSITVRSCSTIYGLFLGMVRILKELHISHRLAHGNIHGGNWLTRRGSQQADSSPEIVVLIDYGNTARLTPERALDDIKNTFDAIQTVSSAWGVSGQCPWSMRKYMKSFGGSNRRLPTAETYDDLEEQIRLRFDQMVHEVQ